MTTEALHPLIFEVKGSSIATRLPLRAIPAGRECTQGTARLWRRITQDERRAPLRPGDGVPEGRVGRARFGLRRGEGPLPLHGGSPFAFSREHADWTLLERGAG